MFFITKIKRQLRRRIIRRVRRRVVRRKKKPGEYTKHKDAALALAISRAAHFNTFYNFTYNKITVRDQTSRWGSCSRKGNLNFNYRIALLPPELSDYIIVHELCHLGEFNHSKDFWNLVARTMPDYQKMRNELKKKGRELF